MNIIKRIFHFFGIIKRKNLVDKEDSIELKSTVVREIKVYTTPQEYPIRLKLNNKYPIEFEILALRNDKGVLENFFFDYLKRRFPNKVFNSISIKVGQKEITPDIAFIDNERNIFIDIEIDEPYTINNGSLKPIHIISTDDNRNQLLLNNGWNVIRFAEKQIALHPDDCVDLINNFINGDLICELNKIPCWTLENALTMISEKERDKYLPLEFQNNGKIYSDFTYRSFKIISINYTGIKNQAKHVLLKFDDNEPNQCWIPENIFWDKIKESIMWELIIKYNVKKNYWPLFDSTIYHDFIPFLINNGWFLNGLGIMNHEYFNLEPNYEFKLCCSDSVFTKFENHIKDGIQKIVEYKDTHKKT